MSSKSRIKTTNTSEAQEPSEDIFEYLEKHYK